MKKTLKRLCTGFLALATVVTALPTTTVHAESKQYWTESAERVGIIEKVMNDGSIGSTFNEGMMKVEGETAYCIDINTDFKNGYKTRADASSRMSADQISDVALSLEYVKQYGEAHKELNYKQVYLLEQCVVWQRLSVHLGWQCDNVRASYNEIPKATQDEVFSGAKAFVKENNQYLTVAHFDNATAQAIMNEALKYQGWKYVYGGSNPNTSFDCSGLVQWCYGKAGISLPRTAQAQYDATQHLPLSQAKAGDLVFFHSTYNAGSYVTHVGILVSPTQMYHAGDPIGYADLSSSYWQQHLIGAGRVKQ